MRAGYNWNFPGYTWKAPGYTQLDAPAAIKERIFEVINTPLLHDQLIEIVTKSDFPEELKDHILKGCGNWIPYGSLERRLQEEVLVSLREKIRNLPLSWEVLDQLYMKIGMEALLLNAPPEEVLVQFFQQKIMR